MDNTADTKEAWTESTHLVGSYRGGNADQDLLRRQRRWCLLSVDPLADES